MIDIPAFSTAYFLVGLLARKLKWLSALATLSGYFVAALIAWWMGLFPSFVAALSVLLIRAVFLVPIQLVILFVMYKRWPSAFASP